MCGGLDMEEGLASGAGGEGVVALSAARHVGTVRLGQAVDRVDVCFPFHLEGVDNVNGCAGAVMLPIYCHLVKTSLMTL